MRRRRLTALLLVAGATAAAGCTTFENGSSVATVNDAEVSQDDLDAALDVLLGDAPTTDTSVTTTAPPANVGSEDARSVLGFLISAHASRDFIAAAGESISAAELEEAGGGDESLAALPDGLRTLFTEYQAGGAARGRAGAETAQADYEAGPYQAGAVCLRAIVVEDENLVGTVQEALEAGTPFAEVATEFSTDPSAADGGALVDPNTGTKCFAASGIPLDTGGELALAASELGVGEYSDPIQQASADGASQAWLIIYGRPYDEVADEVVSLHGDRAFTDYLRAADIDVDPRYGRWDAETGGVVSLDA